MAEPEFKLTVHGLQCLLAHYRMNHEAEFYLQSQMSVVLLYYCYKFQVVLASAFRIIIIIFPSSESLSFHTREH